MNGGKLKVQSLILANNEVRDSHHHLNVYVAVRI